MKRINGNHSYASRTANACKTKSRFLVAIRDVVRLGIAALGRRLCSWIRVGRYSYLILRLWVSFQEDHGTRYKSVQDIHFIQLVEFLPLTCVHCP